VLEIIEKWREAAYSEVKSLKLRENLFNVECSEVQYGGGNESLWKRFIGVVSDEKWKTGVKAQVN